MNRSQPLPACDAGLPGETVSTALRSRTPRSAHGVRSPVVGGGRRGRSRARRGCSAATGRADAGGAGRAPSPDRRRGRGPAGDHGAHGVEGRQRERVEDPVAGGRSAAPRQPRRRGTSGAPPCRAAPARRRAPRASSRASGAARVRATPRSRRDGGGVPWRDGSGRTGTRQSERFAVSGDAYLERIYADGRWVEGPAYSPAWRCLLFSDIPNDRVLRWDETTGAVGVFAQPCGNANGRTIDRRGRGDHVRARRAARHPPRARRHRDGAGRSLRGARG